MLLHLENTVCQGMSHPLQCGKEDEQAEKKESYHTK
jgi:hypothetical protein